MTIKRLFINTMGCQMNVYDSWQIQNRLAVEGYIPTSNMEQADIILVNTCSIRNKAEQKAFSFMGRLAPLKRCKPQLIIGIGGCVAQQDGHEILKRMPFVDLVFGTHAIGRLPRHIERICATRCRVVDIEISESISPNDFILGPYPQSEVSAFVTIMRGCDNFCTYCVVPYVRGRESSRSAEDIVAEIRHLVSKGVREVTLLGQNVNSYGQKEEIGSFSLLLEKVSDIDGLNRIRFTTSHPKDLSMELIQCYQYLEKLCHHIHLPVQSGSNFILKRMNRRYTRQDYADKVAALRKVCPDIAITTDIIVGFPGESQSDFLATLDLLDQIKFDGIFAFIYSDRPNAPATHFNNKIEENEKKERLKKVLNHQEHITLAKNQKMVGTVQQVLIDGINGQGMHSGVEKKDELQSRDIQWTGRTTTNRIVHLHEKLQKASVNQMLTGQTLRIMIEEALPHCLIGRCLSS